MEKEEVRILMIEIQADLLCIKPLAVNVVKTVKCHLNQQAISRFFAVNVLVIKAAAMQEDQIIEEILADLIMVKKECIGPLVIVVAITVKFPLGQQAISLFIAITVLARVKNLIPEAIIKAGLKPQVIINS